MSSHTYTSHIKRTMDRCLALVVLVALGVPMLILAIWIKLDSPGPVFFRQERWGLRGRTFRLWKFRSMRHRPDRIPYEIKGNDSEVTALGRWLRRFRIDEIPNLFNVLLGDLSLVGPRPCLPDHHDLQSPECQRRLEVRPGCTGLAVAQGAQSLPWEDRWRYDAWYLEHQSLWLDLEILFKSVGVILWGDQNFVIPFGAFLQSRGGGEVSSEQIPQIEPRVAK